MGKSAVSPLGLEIRRRRRAIGETQASLAGKLGVDRATVGEWERGEVRPSPQSMRGMIRTGLLTADDAKRLITFPGEDPGPAVLRPAELPITAETRDEVPPVPAPLTDDRFEGSSAVPGFNGRPAIAVMAFENNSDDRSQDYFAAGVTEDVVEGLGRWRWFPVIVVEPMTRPLSRPVDVQRLGAEVGARYVVRGTVRRADDRLRLTVNLIDATTRMRMWGEQFDRELADIFDVQDDITRNIVSHCAPEIMMAESERAARARPNNLTSWDALARGLWFHNRFSKTENEIARDLFKEALKADPDSALALAWMSATHIWDYVMGWSRSRRRSLSMGLDCATRAFSVDSRETTARVTLSVCYAYAGDLDRAKEEGEHAISLNPSHALAYSALGWAQLFLGDATAALRSMETCMRLSPRDPYRPHFLSAQSLAYIVLGDYDQAVERAQAAIRESPMAVRAHHRLACALALRGETARAKAALADSRRILPTLTRDYLDSTHPFTRSEDRALFFKAMRLAGWRG